MVVEKGDRYSVKIIWASNAHMQPTGYGTVCKNVVSYIQNNSEHQMVEVAISGLSRVLPFDWNGVKVYGASGLGGKLGIGDWPSIQAQEKADVWMLNFDAWAVGKSIVQTGIDYVLYPPIDHDPLPPLWDSALQGAREIVPYCEFGERVMREGLGITSPIARPIPHGVDLSVFRPMDVDKSEVFGRRTDGFVAGIFKNNQGTRSRYDVQLEGFRRFVDIVGDNSVRLYIHADRTTQQGFDIVDLVKRYGLTGYVYAVAPMRYRQGLSVEEMAETYNACDVVLNAVAGEGWGLPITEGFACGKPVIGTAFSSMPELLSGVEGETIKKTLDHAESIETERGWLVPTSGSEYTLGKRSTRRTIMASDVADALVKAYENPDKRKAMGINALEYVKQYDWEEVGKQWVKYFDGLEKRVSKKYTWSKSEEETTVGENKTAVAVFAWNRPDYLVQTLNSLAQNTRIDECDVFLYSDGWKNNSKYPYTTDESGMHDVVNQVREILETYPFAHKKVITREENVCIGRQLQDAKRTLFADYEHVIFLDDDIVVSRDYIDVLLKLHKQYPSAIVGAQATEARNIPVNAQLDELGITMIQQSDVESKAGRWRWLAYLMPKSVYDTTLDEMAEYMDFIGPSYRDIPHNAVRIKYGVTVSGFDGVLDKICDKHSIARIATVIPRAKYIGETGLFGTPTLYKQMGFPSNPQIEFDEPDEYHYPGDGVKGLDLYASRSYSQNGEDGIIRHIFSEIGYGSKKFLEFGFAVPECNTWRLMKEEGFTGQYMDVSSKVCTKLRETLEAEHMSFAAKGINIKVTAENIEQYTVNLPEEIDILSIDVDGNDYWVWKAMKRLSPRVVVIEYNAALGKDASITMPYDPDFEWHGGAYYGASLKALEKLGKEKGYRLIGCDSFGVNAFFLRDDIIGSTDETLTAEEAYRPNPKTAPQEKEWASVENRLWDLV